MNRNWLLFLLLISLNLNYAQKDSVYSGENHNKRKTNPDPKKNFPLKDKLVYGGYIMPGFSNIINYGSIFYINASPNIGYKVSDRLTLGVGFNYTYASITQTRGGHYTQSIYGPSLFGRYKIFDHAFLQAQYNKINQPDYYAGTGERIWVDYVLVGGGYYQKISDKVAFVFTALYNVTPNRNSVYNNPVIQIGVVAGF